MAKESPSVTSGGFSAKGVVRVGSGITGRSGANVNPTYKESVPPLPQGAPKVKFSPNVTITSPGTRGQIMTSNDRFGNAKYDK